MMRYKNLVLKDLERIGITLSAIKNGMDNKSISEKEVYDNIIAVLNRLDNVIEKVELEPDATT